MKSNTHFLKVMCVVVCVSLMMVILILTGSPSHAADDCYKHITLKNEGAYVANATVYYSLGGVWPPIQSGNFSHGDTKRIPIPCAARYVELTAKAIAGKTIITKNYENAENRCYKVKGTTLHPSYESCDDPGAGSQSDCSKYITLENEAAYVANATASYVLNGRKQQPIKTGNFSHGHIERMPIPCPATNVELTAKAVAGKTILTKTYAKAENWCYKVKGTTLNPSYEPCRVHSELERDIVIKSSTLYVTQLTVKYDDRGERQTKERSIAGLREEKISIPWSATNIDVKAKAVGGETIFEKHYDTARDLCYTVRGSTLNTSYWDRCY